MFFSFLLAIFFYSFLIYDSSIICLLFVSIYLYLLHTLVVSIWSVCVFLLCLYGFIYDSKVKQASKRSLTRFMWFFLLFSLIRANIVKGNNKQATRFLSIHIIIIIACIQSRIFMCFLIWSNWIFVHFKWNNKLKIKTMTTTTIINNKKMTNVIWTKLLMNLFFFVFLLSILKF